jgi:hypothetical protein
MNATYTPGPWATDGRWIVQEVEGKSFWSGQPFIADCLPSQSIRGNDNTQANAKLIAAAPELLCMLQRMLDEAAMSDVAQSHFSALTLEQARNAIAKATFGAGVTKKPHCQPSLSIAGDDGPRS